MFVVFLMLWVINWLGTFVGPTAQSILTHLSITEHFEDFARGVIDTRNLLFWGSVAAASLHLAVFSLERRRLS